MPSRRPLRARVLGFTAVYAAMLLTVTFVLTWRGREAQQRAQRVVAVDLRVAMLLSDLARTQNAYLSQWRDALVTSSVPSTYAIVRQLGDSPMLAQPEYRSLRSSMSGFESADAALRERWAILPLAAKRGRVGELEARSREVIRQALAGVDRHQRRTQNELPALDREARNTMWIGLSIAWIIAMLSFAIARLTLARVVQPLEELSLAAEEIAAGNLTVRAPIAGDREIARLADSFNRMAASLLESDTKLRERARTDELTGLPNFRAFRETIDAEIVRSARYTHGFGLLILDLDHFKQYNDRFGHAAGNEALQAVARVIRERLRVVDLPARYGGEEFAVVCPELDAEGLLATAERIREAVAALPRLAPDRVTVTMSLGGALYPVDGTTAAELFVAADERLYEAKRAGRNRSVVSRKQTAATLAV